MTSLNPVFTVGEQIAEVLRLHMGMSPRAAAARAEELLDRGRHPQAAAAREFVSRTSSRAASSSA